MMHGQQNIKFFMFQSKRCSI